MFQELAYWPLGPGREVLQREPKSRRRSFFPLCALQEAAQRAKRKGSNNLGTQGGRHATAVVTLASFLLFYVSLQATGPFAERASLSYKVSLPRT